MNARAMRLAGKLMLFACGAAVWAAGHAGQNCTAQQITGQELRRSIELATATTQYLQRSGVKAAILARAGKNLDEYGLRYSHLGIAYFDAEALDGRGAWRVLHKLNRCGTDRGDVYRQGLLEFFADDLYRYEAGIVPLRPEAQDAVLRAARDKSAVVRLHQPRYNMLAYPWETRYQQSNQWAIETLASWLDADIDSRRRAQSWLRAKNYRPTTLDVPALKRLGARIGSAHIAFDDHPMSRRMAGQIDTVTVDSVFRWLVDSGIGGGETTLRATDAPPAPPAVPLRLERTDYRAGYRPA
ncbi:MAG TPA: DUF2145 domain-containing protein [Rhodocyclaceae bacterium]|nr:DUF2145 domain-containing protein [Rhodocyclaceae bacterium]